MARRQRQEGRKQEAEEETAICAASFDSCGAAAYKRFSFLISITALLSPAPSTWTFYATFICRILSSFIPRSSVSGGTTITGAATSSSPASRSSG